MSSITVRYMENRFQLSSDASGKNQGGYGYLEVLLCGVHSFSSLIRGKKFYWRKNGQRVNPFDDCNAYLGKLLQGKWISESEYQVFVQTVNDAWARHDAMILAACAPSVQETVPKAPQWDLVPYRWESCEAVSEYLNKRNR